MPRLPSEEEVRAAQAQAAAHLEEVWATLHSPKASAAVFNDVEHIIQVPLSPWSRIPIAEALRSYCRRVEEAQNEREAVEEVIEQAKRLVGRMRREIEGLKNTRDTYEQQLAEAQAWARPRLRKLAAETGRECAALYLSIKDAVGELERSAGRQGGICGDSSPHDRLADPTNEVWEAVWKVQPPFRYAKCEMALSDLNGLLKDWGTKTGSRKGQSWENKALNDLIKGLGKVFEAATGTRAVNASDQFNPVLNRLLDALPAKFGRYYKRGEEALAKRSLRVRREGSASRR